MVLFCEIRKREGEGIDFLGYVVDPTDTHFLSFYFAVCHRKWRCGSSKNPMLSPQGLSNKCHPSFEAAIVELNIFQQLKHISFWDLKGHTTLFGKPCTSFYILCCCLKIAINVQNPYSLQQCQQIIKMSLVHPALQLRIERKQLWQQTRLLKKNESSQIISIFSVNVIKASTFPLVLLICKKIVPGKLRAMI